MNMSTSNWNLTNNGVSKITTYKNRGGGGKGDLKI